MPTPRNVIHVVDVCRGGNPVAHVAKEIWLDGSPLLLTETDGFEISSSDTESTVVTLRVLPTSVHYVHRDLAAKQMARGVDAETPCRNRSFTETAGPYSYTETEGAV